MKKFAVKNPVERRTSGARTNRTESEKKACRPGRASTGLDCVWRFTTRRPPESMPSAEKARRLLARYDRAYTRTSFQERDFAAGQAAVMDEFFAQRATRPPAGKKRLVAVELFLTDLALPGLDPQQHRLPIPSTIPDTHGTEYSEGERCEARGEGHTFPHCRTDCSRGL